MPGAQILGTDLTLGANVAREQFSRNPARRTRRKFTDYILFIFILSVLLPYRMEVGPFLLSPNRIFLLLMLVPCALMLLAGKAGRLRAVDILIFAHAIWMALALIVVEGLTDGIEPAGIQFVEVIGSYLIARCLIRSAETFYSVIRMLFVTVMVMVPLLITESVTGDHILNRLVSLFGPAIVPPDMDRRMGFARASGVFDHPILLGVYCMSVISLSFYVLGYQSKRLIRYFRTAPVVVAAATSMSAGPLVAMMVQFGLIGWEHVTRALKYRWQILGGLAAAMYVLVDLISNRTPFHIIVTYLTFNATNAYNRILIWHFGTAEVARHPLFGIGHSDWQRPDWMSSSMDNFWLVLAVRGGIPALFFFAAAVLALCYGVARRRLSERRLISYRLGWMFTIVGLVLAGATVDYWKVVFSLLMFLIASGVWMLDVPGRKPLAQPPEPPAAKPANRMIRLG